MNASSRRRVSALPVYIALGVLALFTVIFIVEFISASNPNTPEMAVTLTARTYMDKVEALLRGADTANGDKLLDRYECGVCHRMASERVAPSFVGMAARAATRRTPLTAAAYIYESIAYPGAYVVEGYSNVMLRDYLERLSERELGDMIAYLLTEEAK